MMRRNICKGLGWQRFAVAVLAIVVGLSLTATLHAQLGWEGETGVFVTPLAYTAGAAGKIKAESAYHYFHAGPVIGDFHEASVEAGLGSRVEIGYTREMHVYGSDN